MKRTVGFVSAVAVVLAAVGVGTASAEVLDDGVLEFDLSLGAGAVDRTFELAAAGDYTVSAAAVADVRTSRTEPLGTIATHGGGAEVGGHVASAAEIAGSVSWSQDVVEKFEFQTGSVAAEGVTSVPLGATAPGTVELTLYPSARQVQVVTDGYAQSPLGATSQSQSGQDPNPALFEVNTGGQITGLLTWQASTLPPRNLDLALKSLLTGDGTEQNSLTGSSEYIDYTVPAGVGIGSPDLFGFTVKNSGTEGHDYTLAWSFPRMAQTQLRIVRDDGTVVGSTTGTGVQRTLTATLTQADVDAGLHVEVVSEDHPAGFQLEMNYPILQYANLRVELLDRTGDVLASASGDAGQLDLVGVADGSGATTWRATTSARPPRRST